MTYLFRNAYLGVYIYYIFIQQHVRPHFKSDICLKNVSLLKIYLLIYFFFFFFSLQMFFGCSCIIFSNFLHGEREYLTGAIDKPRGESILEKNEISPRKFFFSISYSCFVSTYSLIAPDGKRTQA